MKRLHYTLAAVVVAVTLCLLASGTSHTAKAGIVGSKHDFTRTDLGYPAGWSKGQICLPCHAPHNTTPVLSSGGDVVGPLWNRTVNTSKTYSMYINGKAASGQLDQNSMLCMSCHDGTIALDSFGGATGSTTINESAQRGANGDLTQDHPMGDAAVYPTGVTYMVDPAKRDAKRIMPLRDLNGKKVVGCTSCHEPHDRANTPTTPTKNMLWVSNDTQITTVDNRTVPGSGLCLNCHVK